MLDLTKPVQTRNGFNDVEIIAINGRTPNYPIIGYLGGNNILHYWTVSGLSAERTVLDLVNVPEKHIVYLNIYDSTPTSGIMSYKYATKAEADKIAKNTESYVKRTACIRVEYTDGQFDE